LKFLADRRSRGLGIAIGVCLCLAMTIWCGKSPGGPTTASSTTTASTLRIEGPAGADLGIDRRYFDNGNVDLDSSVETIPASGVFTENLTRGHAGLRIQVQLLQGKDKITVIILDGTREIDRAVAHGSSETATVKEGPVQSAN
jgi:hypothetical protein